jgi:hypothetical protein
LLGAAVVHVVLVLAITFLGKTQAAPNIFDANGIGVSFAVDSTSYRYEAEVMARLIQQGRLQDWWNFVSRYRAAAHVRFYSIPFALLGGFAGYGILAAEPLNLFYYLAIVALTYGLAVEVFDRRVGMLAATAVALWPSLMLYSTQMLRDPLVIAAVLLLVLSLAICIRRSLPILQGVAVGVLGSAAVLLLWLCRSDMWELIFLVVTLAIATVTLDQLIRRRFEKGKTLAAIVILAFTFGLPRVVPAFRLADFADQETLVNPGSTADSNSPAQPGPDEKITAWTKLARQVGFLRHRFIIRYPGAGSNIDADVELRGTGDLVRYLPRATAIGLLAPFPNMWFGRGRETGHAGRLLTGGEMLIVYLLLALAVVTLIYDRKRLLVWFILTVGASGCIAMAFVVVNISSLYRIRYPFFILLLILGVRGWLIVWKYLIERKTQTYEVLRQA